MFIATRRHLKLLSFLLFLCYCCFVCCYCCRLVVFEGGGGGALVDLKWRNYRLETTWINFIMKLLVLHMNNVFFKSQRLCCRSNGCVSDSNQTVSTQTCTKAIKWFKVSCEIWHLFFLHSSSSDSDQSETANIVKTTTSVYPYWFEPETPLAKKTKTNTHTTESVTLQQVADAESRRLSQNSMASFPRVAASTWKSRPEGKVVPDSKQPERKKSKKDKPYKYFEN